MKKENQNSVIVIRRRDRLSNSELVNVCGGTTSDSDGECTDCNCFCGNENKSPEKKDELSTK